MGTESRASLTVTLSCSPQRRLAHDFRFSAPNKSRQALKLLQSKGDCGLELQPDMELPSHQLLIACNAAWLVHQGFRQENLFLSSIR